jgi:hypothetical protein
MATCQGCSTQAFLDCTCPEDHLLALGGHRQDCSHFNIDASVACPPGAGCCTEKHDHGAAANACPGGHDDTACPEDPHKCGVWKGAIADAFHPEAAGVHPLLRDLKPGDDPPPCPGGHCHKDIPACTVCRPLTITVLPGTQVTPILSGTVRRAG